MRMFVIQEIVIIIRINLKYLKGINFRGDYISRISSKFAFFREI